MLRVGTRNSNHQDTLDKFSCVYRGMVQSDTRISAIVRKNNVLYTKRHAIIWLGLSFYCACTHAHNQAREELHTRAHPGSSKQNLITPVFIKASFFFSLSIASLVIKVVYQQTGLSWTQFADHVTAHGQLVYHHQVQTLR